MPQPPGILSLSAPAPSQQCAHAYAAGPFGFYFYHGLDRLAAGLFAHGSFRFIAFKTLADALVYEPLFVLSEAG